MPMFASGHRSHHPRIVAVSVVASRHPFGVRGCFPGFVPVHFGSAQVHAPLSMLCNGNTRQPYCAAYIRALRPSFESFTAGIIGPPPN